MSVMLGDCRNHILSVSPDLVVTSPPYDDMRTYGSNAAFGEHVWKPVFELLFYNLQEGAVVVWNVGDSTENGTESGTSFRQALFAMQTGFNLHDTMIWQKSNFSNPSTVRYHQLFEYVFVFSKGKPKTFNPIKDKPNKYKECWGKNTSRKKNGEMQDRKKNVIGDFGMRGNVWLGNTAGQENVCTSLPHPAMMPLWLARDMILSWSNPGELVYDPFAGSGTTGIAALRTGRKFVGSELNPEFQKIANWRLFDEV